MCGIAGIVGRRQVNGAAVQAMTRLLEHRGPDGEGFWRSDDGRVVFGHRRLAIVDLSDAAAQPMHDVTGRFVLTYNGEIYNYIELRTELRALGARFATSSDTEVILEAYRAWGSACVERFNGMFAFALFDTTTGILFCARDRFGEKPFLFGEGDGFFAFASEYKSLLALRELPIEIDDNAIIDFLDQSRQGLDDRRETVFRGVFQLLPGEALELHVADLERNTWRYWSIQPARSDAQPSLEDAASTFRDLLTDSIRLRFRSDVAVGSCLSGGLDSSAIVVLARSIIGPKTPYHAFTGRFPDTAADEGRFAAMVATHANITTHEVAPSGRDFLTELPRFMWHNELPVGSSSQYAQWSVFRIAREAGITVLLDGQGADELLGGYEQYFINYLSNLRAAGRHEELERERKRIEARYGGSCLHGFAVFMNAYRWRGADD
jgi:asparagine synthase (glutamine-hydrolysing)